MGSPVSSLRGAFSLSSGGLLTLGLVLAPTPLRADTIPITAGTLEIFGSGFPVDRLHLEGTRGFTLDGENITAIAPIPLVKVEWVGRPFPCAAGERVSLMVDVGGSDFNADATLDGRAFHTNIISNEEGEAHIVFDGSLLVPSFSGTERVSVFSPFSFSGILSPPLQDEDGTVVPERLMGRGTARVDLAWVSSPEGEGWLFQHALYEFQTPVPEPGTFLLVGSGIAGYLIRRRRRTSGRLT
jgi:hypothetical protein